MRAAPRKYETVELPTIRLDDGRYAITAESAVDFPWVAEFVARFPNYYVFDSIRQCWLSPAEDDELPRMAP